MLGHVGAGAIVLVRSVHLLCDGLGRGGDAKVAASVGALVRLRTVMNSCSTPSLFGGALTLLLCSSSGNGRCPSARRTSMARGGCTPRRAAFPTASQRSALSALMVYPETEWVKAIDLAHLAMR